MDEFKRQQDIWAEELRKADARAQKFKDSVDELQEIKRQLKSDNASLEEKIHSRDQEILRLQKQYKGGQNFDDVKQNYDLDRLESENEEMRDALLQIGNVVNITFTPDRIQAISHAV